jgi:hypothetical protein
MKWVDLRNETKNFLYKESFGSFPFDDVSFFLFHSLFLSLSLSFSLHEMSTWLWNRPDPNDITTKAKVRVNRFCRSTDEVEKKQLLEELQEIVGDVATHEEVGTIIPHLIRFMEKKDDLGTLLGGGAGTGRLRVCGKCV